MKEIMDKIMDIIKNLLPERNNIKCPYCDSEVSYIQALSEVSTGEHTCPVCNKNSNIKYDKKIYLPAGILLGIAVIVTILLFILDVKSNPILAICIVIIPFAVFFFLTPFYFKLQAIRSEAQTPVVKHKLKSKKRSEITPRAVKFEEKKRIQKEKEKEKKVMENNGNSFKSKFSKFVKTYILVDDDDETEVKASVKNSDDEIKSKPVKEEKVEKLPIESKVDSIEDDDEEINIEPEEEFVEDDGIDTVDPLAEDEEDLSFIEVYTDKKAYEKQKTPVYHKMTKTKNVDFIYLPEDKETISVDVKTEETTDYTDLDDEEDILNFFDSAPTAEEEKEFGVKKNENKEVKVKKSKTEKDFSYTSENKESIAVSVKADEADEDNFKFEDLETSSIENTSYRDAVNKFAKKQKSNSFLKKEEGETAEVGDNESDEDIKEYKKSSLQLSKPTESDFTDILVQNEIDNAQLNGNEDVLEYNPEMYYVVEDNEENSHNESDDEGLKNEVIEFSETYVDTFPREDEENKYATTSGDEIDLSEFKTSNYVEDDSENVEASEEKEVKENNKESKAEKKTETPVEAPKVVIKSISAPPAPKKVDNKGKKSKKPFNGKNRNYQANSPVKQQVQAEKNVDVPKADNRGFFSKIKSKLIDMTEEEREETFNQEERERKLAEKEARRKAKEKEKELAEKSKREKELAEIKQAKKENREKKAEESKNAKTIEKTKTETAKPEENESAADQKTKVFKIPVQEKVADDYKSQEKIVFESVKDKAAKFEDKKITQEEKVKIISEKDKEEKRQANINKQKAEQAKRREQGEKQNRNKKLQNERQQKNEQYRQNQVKKAQESQNKIKQSSEKRNINNVKLKDVNNVRSKVSQNQAKKREEMNKFFKD